jgi:hypothetical protein
MPHLATLHSPVRWLMASWKQPSHGGVTFFSLRVRTAESKRTISIKFVVTGKGKFVPVQNKLSTTSWRSMREWRYSSAIFELCARWRWVVSCAPWPLCSGKLAPVPTGWEAGWKRRGKEKICSSGELNSGCPARIYTDWALLAYAVLAHISDRRWIWPSFRKGDSELARSNANFNQSPSIPVSSRLFT